MTLKKDRGDEGEALAGEYLAEKGYKIIEKNHRQKWGELDIVTHSPDKTLVFIEVKTIYTDLTNKSNWFITPEENLTHAKLHKLQRTAYLYANANPKLVDDKRGWRIDLVAINVGDMGGVDIRHYENI